MKFSIKKQGFLYTSKSVFLKKGFTIREILIVIVILSVGLLSVVVVLTDGMGYVQKTRQKIIALNLAREWMEAVYQIRDTNRMRRAWVKDQCWLKINPLLDEWNSACFTDDLRFTSGAYVLQRLSTGGQEYFALTGMMSWIILENGTYNSWFSLCQQSGYWDTCPIDYTWTTTEGRYFRQITWRWLYLKDTPFTWWSEITCTWSLGPDLNCNDNNAKEFRFCSKVVYIGKDIGEVELCGVITNFKGEE
jgi:prepilin-type N-terminal cleavage/methylation domain-containing protein